MVKALRCESDGLGIDPGGVTGDFFSEATDRTMCPGVDSAPRNGYQGISTRVKATGA